MGWQRNWYRRYWTRHCGPGARCWLSWPPGQAACWPHVANTHRSPTHTRAGANATATLPALPNYQLTTLPERSERLQQAWRITPPQLGRDCGRVGWTPPQRPVLLIAVNGNKPPLQSLDALWRQTQGGRGHLVNTVASISQALTALY